MGKVYVFDHPLIQHKTAIIRKTDTSTKDFRQLVKEIAMLMGYEATRQLWKRLISKLQSARLQLKCSRART